MSTMRHLASPIAKSFSEALRIDIEAGSWTHGEYLADAAGRSRRRQSSRLKLTSSILSGPAAVSLPRRRRTLVANVGQAPLFRRIACLDRSSTRSKHDREPPSGLLA
jgi:hypothetical protein